MKKIFGYIFLAISVFGFYVFVNYLIFEFQGSGDDGLGSYALWISGWGGFLLGIISIAIGFPMVGFLKGKDSQKELKN